MPKPEECNVLFDAWQVSRAAGAVIGKAIEDSGLDADEFAIYSVLAARESLTPTELSHWMSAPPTTVSSYVKRLVARRHVERRPNPEDGRSYRIALTRQGRQAHRRAGERFDSVLAAVQARLGVRAPEVHRQLIVLLDALNSLDPPQDGPSAD